jgi:hypothetical protein
MAHTNPEPQVPPPAPADELLPRYSASEQPVTRGYRIAFQIWVICFLLTLVVTLALYLFDKIYAAF